MKRIELLQTQTGVPLPEHADTLQAQVLITLQSMDVGDSFAVRMIYRDLHPLCLTITSRASWPIFVIWPDQENRDLNRVWRVA